MTTNISLPIEQYHVGIICALRHEMTAAIAALDERHQPIAVQDKLDNNNYALGRIHNHNVVIACVPAGVYGTNAAARVANDMLRTFIGLRFGLMVGIGGGIPNLAKDLDIRLGDVVISQPDKTFGGVVQYDLRKNLGEGQFEHKGFLKPPPTILLAALSTLQAEHDLNDSRVPDILEDIVTKYPNLVKNGYGFPGQERDALYCPRCNKSSSSNSCGLCIEGKIKRPTRQDSLPSFWYGVIASGNELMKNAVERDRIGQEFGAMCVEMEAAGLMNDFPCIVIRGICDYADNHKNDGWQKYAALVAAAYAKELLGYISPQQTSFEKPVQDIVASLAGHLAKQSSLVAEHLHEVKRENKKQDQRYFSDQHHQCHQAFKTSTYEQFKDINPDRVEGTCKWVLCHPQYLQWHTKPHDDLLWISADPGCGKSVLTRSLVDNELRPTDQHTVCYFFFKDNEEQDNLATALCALLHQLFTYQPHLIRYGISARKKAGNLLANEIPELWRTLVAAASDSEAHDVTCVLDALDECRPSDRGLLIELLSSFYTQISTASSTTRSGRLKFLVTSRPYYDIQADFQKTLDNLPTIRLQGEEENDQIHNEIDLVIRMRVAKLATDLQLDDQTSSQLETKLLEMQHRTYLWLYLAIQGVYETYRNSLRPEEASIRLLPSSVEDAYEKILDRVSEDQKATVKKILKIVVGARRPLTVQEMAIALGIATSTFPEAKSLYKVQLDHKRLQNIRDWCGLFVFINHQRIYLIHQTAKEFLIGGHSSAISLSGWKHCLHPQEIEKDMTLVCVEFLCLEEIGPLAASLIQRSNLRENKWTDIRSLAEANDTVESFLVYSAEYWPSHLRAAEIPIEDPAMADVAQLCDTDSPLSEQWLPIFWNCTHKMEKAPQMNAIHLAAIIGHGQILKTILQLNQQSKINEFDTYFYTPLMRATEFNHIVAVQILLGQKADVNLQAEEFPNALIVASISGHLAVLETLLEHGADVNAWGWGCSALQAASYRGDIIVVETLLEHGAEVNTPGGEFGNALQAASYGGDITVVETLLEHGAEVNTPGGEFGNALQAASYGGDITVVETLLEHGADVNAQGGRYGSALMAAERNYSLEIVKILLERGARHREENSPQELESEWETESDWSAD